MLKIPKQIYFDQETLDLYSAYARSENKSFAAIIRDVLKKKAPQVKEKVATQPPKSNFLSLFGSVKSPYGRKFTSREERRAFEKGMGESAAREGL